MHKRVITIVLVTVGMHYKSIPTQLSLIVAMALQLQTCIGL